MLGQCTGYNPAGRLWLLIHREREWWMEVFWETVDRTSHPTKLSGNMVQMRAKLKYG